MRAKKGSTTVALLMATVALTGQQQARDHPLVSRFQGSEVQDYRVSEFDQFALPLGAITGDDTFAKVQPLEGKITMFKYSMPAGRSAFEVSRSYQNALQGAGFEILFTCGGKDCISDKFKYGYTHAKSGIWCATCEEPMQYVAAKLSQPTGDAYVAVVVVRDKFEGGTWLSIVESKPMGAGLVTVNAAALANDITTTGHASVYGIYFDTGKATLTPESDQALGEIGKLLSANASLKLHVIGHTDNVGTVPANMALSKQRADAVVAALVTRYHVAPTRLQAAGVGPLAPVATNRTDDGRAKNRRVELVEQ